MLDENLYNETVQKACELVRGFAHQYSLKPERLVAMAPEGKLNSTIKDFGDYVVLRELAGNWGNDGYMSEKLATATPLFIEMPVRTSADLEGATNGFASWFYGIPSQTVGRTPQLMRGVFSAVLDEELITRGGRETQIDPRFLRIRLYYHELGHFVFHRNTLLANAKRAEGVIVEQRATPATAQMEEQAWLFSIMIVAIALADHSYALRIAGRPDDAWLFPGHMH